MDIVVKTLRGPIELQGLGAGVSIAEVKQLLHERHKDGPMAIPDPKLQRLVSTTPQGWWDNQRMRDLWLPPKRDEARDALRALRARASGASAQLLRASRSGQRPPVYSPCKTQTNAPSPLLHTATTDERSTRAACCATAPRRSPTPASATARRSCCSCRPSCRRRRSP